MKKILIALLLLPAVVFAQSYPSPTFQNLTVLGTLTTTTPTFSTPLGVSSGGTGAASLTSHGVLLGQGTGAVSAASPSSTVGLALLSSGSSADPVFGTLGLSALTAISANTIVANVTGSSASPAAFSMPTCSASSCALGYTPGTGITANTSIDAATLNGASLPSGAVSLIANFANVNLTAQTSSIATTTAYAVPSGRAGLYLVSVDIICTTAGTGGTVSATLGWNNGSASATASTGATSLSTLGSETTQTFAVYSAAIQNITYATTVSGAAGSPQYAIRVRVLSLG